MSEPVKATDTSPDLATDSTPAESTSAPAAASNKPGASFLHLILRTCADSVLFHFSTLVATTKAPAEDEDDDEEDDEEDEDEGPGLAYLVQDEVRFCSSLTSSISY